MYCYKCGKEILDNSKYCNFCGTEQKNRGGNEGSSIAKDLIKDIVKNEGIKPLIDVLSEEGVNTIRSVSKKVGEDFRSNAHKMRVKSGIDKKNLSDYIDDAKNVVKKVGGKRHGK